MVLATAARPTPARSATLLAAAALLLCAARPARAQVTVDLRALDAPPSGQTAPEAPARKPPPPRRPAPAKPAAKPPANAPAAETPASRAPAAGTTPAGTTPAGTTPAGAPPAGAPAANVPAAPAAPVPPPATIGVAPPPAAVIPEPAPADAPVPPQPPPPIAADAGTTASPLSGQAGAGLRIDFPAGQSNLTPESAAAVTALAARVPAADTTSFNVMAYAAGVPEDPSTARRTSLSRALAVRSVLMAAGVPSARIYVRALGAQGGDGPADRVDLLVMGANAPAGSSASAASPASHNQAPPPPGSTPTRTP